MQDMPDGDVAAQAKTAGQPIFILAASGSHSPLLAAMIGRHPECFGAPELHLFAAPTLEDISLRFAHMRQTQFHGLLRLVSYLHAGEQTMDGVEMARRWMMRRLTKTTAEIFEELQRKLAPLRIVDPSRSYSAEADALPRIRHAYPDAQFLLLVRRSGGSSGAVGTPPALQGPEEQGDPLDLFLDALPAGLGARVEVDEVLSSPETTLPAVCRALGLADDAAAVDRMLHPELSPFSGFGPIGANLGNEADFLRDPAFRREARALA